ncbi:MAG: hypothetical protein HRU26_08350, partial [Psychroserpens sp.]|nr:hypothetical protein [Psychroserpens sp.]
DLGPDIDTCAQTVLLNGSILNDLATYQWFRDGNLIPGATNPLYQTAVSGTYTIQVSIPISNSICMIEDEIVVTLSSEQTVDPITDFELCDDASNDGQELFDLSEKDNEITNAVVNGTYDISYHLSAEDAASDISPITDPYENISNPQTIYVRIRNTITGCLGFTTFNVFVNESPNFDELMDISICDDIVADGITSVGFAQITSDILTANPDYLVSYYTSEDNAENDINPLNGFYITSTASDVVYIKLVDSVTGCFNIIPLNINVLENPELNPDIQWIDACESDGDGFAIFDITSVIDNILQGLDNVTVDFFETETDAIEGTNPILDPTAYQNTIPNFQVVYIRVTNDTTGCSSVMPIELHTNVVETGFDTTPYGLCDDETNDGIAEFDLGLVSTAMVGEYIEWEITFFETEDDQLNDTNAINQNDLYTVSSISTILYFSATLDDCTQYGTIELVIFPAIEIQPLEPVTFCDEDFDGTTIIDLTSFDDYVSTGIDFADVRYFPTEQDAIDNSSQLPFQYLNPTNPILVYCRVTNVQTGCFDIAPLEILVIDPPVVSEPSEIVICDDDQDGFSLVNLEDSISEIVSDTNNLSFTFFTSQEDADTGTNPIPDPANFNTNTKPVIVRIESQITTCYSTVVLNIIVNTLPVFEPIEVYEACESDGDGFNEFLFNTKDEEILNDQTDKEVLYFESMDDALNRANIIDKNNVYGNLTNPQTIYARVENLTDINCFDVTSFQIQVTQFVTFNSPTDIVVCDDDSNDGVDTFDFNQKITEITEGIGIDLDLSFHLSFEDADLNENELPLTYSNTVNPQLIYVRIEYPLLCPAITTFELNIIQIPETNPAPDLVLCDNNYDGLTNFDLTVVETDVLDVRIDDIELFYYESLSDLENDESVIEDPTDYTNLSNPQTVYIKILNRVSNCYNVELVNLQVNLPPLINDFITYDTCFNIDSSFNLEEINSVIVNDDTDVVFSYYNNLSDAEVGNNALNLDYTYSTSNDTVYARVEFLTTGCFYVYPFQLIVNPLPVANQPDDIEACDDDTNDLIETFNLDLATPQVLGNQDPDLFTVSYYLSLEDSDMAVNPLGNEVTGFHDQIIFIRIENNITGCYSLTQLNLVVNPHPNVPTPIVNCDDDYDGITNFDLTLAEPELFVVTDPDNI